MTITFSFDHILTPEETAAINELHRLARAGGAVRKATSAPAPTNTATAEAPVPAGDRERHAAETLTEADVRAAIDAAKDRIWGAGHATDPALTKERKAPLVGAFKAIARLYGAERPSELDGQAARANFIRHVGTLALDPEGNITESDLPF